MPYKDPEKQRAYQRRWARRKGKHKEYRRRVRKEAVEKLGDRCAYCGCDNYDALEINHMNGKGKLEKRTRYRGSTQFHLAIIKGEREIDDLNIACKVCNAWHCLVELMGIPDKWTITYG